MNILIPDSWLRDFLKTKATPKQLKEHLSLCGPSIERVNVMGKETVYDIEITGNRPDSMSVVGVAREAAAILPRAGIAATLIGNPYKMHTANALAAYTKAGTKQLIISADPLLTPRFTVIVIDNIEIKPSPKWLQDRLVFSGVRAINNVVDVTNYIMKMYGQPVHAFDFDKIAGSGTSATMKVRESKKGEKLTTLDGKIHTLPGGDIVIEDYKGTLIDLCGIMGGANSHISDKTKTIVLFMQNYNPANIRKTSMALAHRTEAAALFEKSLDPELVMPSMVKGIDLMLELTGGHVGSKLYDMYPKPYKPYTVSCPVKKIESYVGKLLTHSEIKNILTPLGFATTINKTNVHVTVPSFRRDITIDVDIIEEIARIYGYHNIATRLPDREPPVVLPDQTLAHEEDLKIRLRDWGYTEIYAYSMISEKLMEIFGLETSKAYKLANPLTSDWVYMRPSLLPSMLAAVEQNLTYKDNLNLFELSMTYHYREGNIPQEIPTLMVAFTGDAFRQAKGLAQSIFHLFGIPMPVSVVAPHNGLAEEGRSLALGEYGWVGFVDPTLLSDMNISVPVVVLELHIARLVAHAQTTKTYTPIPKYPPIIEDLSFAVIPGTEIGHMIEMLKKQHHLISSVALLDSYKNNRTFRITYQDPAKTLTTDLVKPIREKLIKTAEEKLNAIFKT